MRIYWWIGNFWTYRIFLSMTNSKDDMFEEVDLQKVVSSDHAQSLIADQIVTDHEKKMVDEYFYIVEAVASTMSSKKKMPPTMEYNDLLSIGFSGLLKAIRRFDESKNVKFQTYANIRVRGEMLDYIRSEWRVRSAGQYEEMMGRIQDRVNQVIDNQLNPLNQAVSINNLLSTLSSVYVVSLEAVMDTRGDNISDPNANVEETAISENDDGFGVMNQWIQKLENEDRILVDMFYKKGLTQKEISAHMSMSEATVSRKHNKVLAVLKGLMDGK